MPRQSAECVRPEAVNLLAVLVMMSSIAIAQPTYSVLSFGATGNGVMRTDGAMAYGSPVLVSASGTFASTDVGKYIQVIGAGPGGTTRNDGSMSPGSSVLNSPSGTFASTDVGRGIIVIGAGAAGSNLVTTIQGYQSPTSVTLNAVAQSVQTSAPYFYGAMTLEATIESVSSPTTATLSTAAAATTTGATYAYGTEWRCSRPFATPSASRRSRATRASTPSRSRTRA